MSLLQQDLRRLLQKFKGKQPFSQQNLNEIYVLAPINPQNTPAQKNKPKIKTDFLKEVASQENFPQKAATLSSKYNRTPVIFSRNEVYQPTSLKMPSFKREKPVKTLKTHAEFAETRDFKEKFAETRDFKERFKETRDFKEKFIENHDFKEKFIENRDFKEKNAENSDFKEEVAEIQDFNEKCAENRDFVENATDFLEDRGYLEEKTKKSPVLQEESREYRDFPLDFEQNTIIKVKLEGCQGIPEVNQSKEQDEIVEKIGELVKLRQSQENYLSFQRFQQENSAEKLDILEKTQKLSFREEDFFEKSMKIEGFHQGDQEMERLEFRLLNEHADQRENTGNFKENAENFNENQGDFEENGEDFDENQENTENFIENAENFNENQVFSLEKEEPPKKNAENLENIEKSVEKLPKSETFGSFLSSPSSFSQQFSRPFDLKPDQRDQYIDEIYLKFRFASDSHENPKDFEALSLEKETFLRINFEKTTIQRMRKLLNLEDLSPENIVEEVFNAQKLSRISKTFFKIKMQVKKQRKTSKILVISLF